MSFGHSAICFYINLQIITSGIMILFISTKLIQFFFLLNLLACNKKKQPADVCISRL